MGETTSSPIYMNWGSDLYAPNEKVAENVRLLNRDGMRFSFATPDDYFAKVKHEPDIPEVSGEIPSSWPNIVSSLPHLWQLVVPATTRCWRPRSSRRSTTPFTTPTIRSRSSISCGRS